MFPPWTPFFTVRVVVHRVHCAAARRRSARDRSISDVPS
jgi:hypothetical protein